MAFLTPSVSLTHLLDYSRVEKARRKWRPVAISTLNQMWSSRAVAQTALNKRKSKQLPHSTFFHWNHRARLIKTKKRVLTKWKFHTWTDLCVYIDHVVLCLPSSMCFKSTFSSFTIRCKMGKFSAGCCSVRRVLLVQGKAGVAAVILLIFLIWANVGGEVKQ